MADDRSRNDAKSGPAMVDRLRDRVDRGGTADKVAFSDPAAAPLGTDDEAAGTPPGAARARMAQEAEASRDAATAGIKSTPADRQNRSYTTTIAVLAFVVILVLLAALAFWFG